MWTQYLLTVVLVFQACLATPLDFEPRITDGVDATPGEFPFLVSIQWGMPPFLKYRHICGGSILNERHVLTAGHCIMKTGKLKILAGKHNIMKFEDFQQEREVEKTIVHENYGGILPKNDIAILKLKTPLTLNEKVSSVYLSTENEVPTGKAVLSGWGSISKSLLPRMASILQKVTVPLLDNPTCMTKLPRSIIGRKPKLSDTQFCTDVAKESSPCSGDSGGPLVQYDSNNTPTQIGIVSWGSIPCGITRNPTVYTRVSAYIKWIHKVLEK